jgi:hypothetical protein
MRESSFYIPCTFSTEEAKRCTHFLSVFYGNPAQTMHSDGSLNWVSRPILALCEGMFPSASHFYRNIGDT